MDDEPSTQNSLLIRLRNADDGAAWRHFVRLYGPLVYRYARKHHLQDADAADVTQEVMHHVSKAIGQLDYDPERGSFRGWLFTLAHRRLCDFLERNKKHVAGSGDDDALAALQQVAGRGDDIWEHEYQQQLFLWAKEEIHHEFTETTWQAFWSSAVDGEPIAKVGERLGISAGAVYIARNRVRNRLREKIKQAEDD